MLKLNLSINDNNDEISNKDEIPIIETDVQLKLIKAYDGSVLLVAKTKRQAIDKTTYLLRFCQNGTIEKIETCFASGFKCDPINGELLFSNQ